MATWPTLDMLKKELGINTNAHDDRLQQVLAAAIEGVVEDCGGDPVEVTFTNGVPTVDLADPSAEDPVEIPVTNRLAEAALLLAVMVRKAPDAPFGVASTFDTGGIYVARRNPNYSRLLKGHRVRFGVA